MHELRDENEPSLADILPRLSPCDLILIEGYKKNNHPKIEVRLESTVEQTLISELDPQIVAIASDQKISNADRPSFKLNDIIGIADFILDFLKLGTKNVRE